MKIKILNNNAVIPKRANESDAGLDLVATSVSRNDMFIEYGTGIAVQFDEGCFGMICARSSISNYHLQLANGVGIIDAGYTGELKLRFRVIPYVGKEKVYEIGDKIGQLIQFKSIVPVSIDVIDSLDDTDRGSGGFGSSGE